MHFECQPHKYAIARTVHRDHPTEAGGHFYIVSYRMRIQAAPNILIVFILSDVHGTSLQDLDPKNFDPKFLQTGITIVTLNCLPFVWNKFCESEMKYQDMVSSMIKSLGEEEESEDEAL